MLKYLKKKIIIFENVQWYDIKNAEVSAPLFWFNLSQGTKCDYTDKAGKSFINKISESKTCWPFNVSNKTWQ